MNSVTRSLALFLSMSWMLLSCRGSEETRASASMPQTGAAMPVGAAAVASAHEVLDQLDTRTPVPLLPMMAHHQKQEMQDHLLVVQEIIQALATDDFAAIGASTKRIGYSEQMGQMCTHMGAGASAFTEQALHFHHTADRIGEAARARDHAGVLRALGSTLETCTSCHAAYKQVVVDAASWTKLTASSAMPEPGMHTAQ